MNTIAQIYHCNAFNHFMNHHYFKYAFVSSEKDVPESHKNESQENINHNSTMGINMHHPAETHSALHPNTRITISLIYFVNTYIAFLLCCKLISLLSLHNSHYKYLFNIVKLIVHLCIYGCCTRMNHREHINIKYGLVIS